MCNVTWLNSMMVVTHASCSAGQLTSSRSHSIIGPCRSDTNHGPVLHPIDPNTSVTGVAVLTIHMVDGLTDYSGIGCAGLELELTPGTGLPSTLACLGRTHYSQLPGCRYCGAPWSASNSVLLCRGLTHTMGKPANRRASIDTAAELAIGPIL